SLSSDSFLHLLADRFKTGIIRHNTGPARDVSKVAVCGGAGSFLIANALEAGADAFVTADLKYHEFFEAESQLLVCDVGHYESEQFTTDLFVDIIRRKFPNFAVLKSGVRTNPVHYFSGK
ncbi:MAG TPA: Nif3-like dinuclear metal center hexameric protein, partial [Flavitalea sp.]|nr:Nif3-like dinuclear metal center hexameric protein [Flavitalea sp.]